MAFGSVGKRKAERRDCHVKAQVLLPGRDPIDCIILNFSATGARATLNAEADLPPRFKLFIPSRPETKPTLLRWRNGLEFGCEYSTGVADENAFFALLDRVDQIEAKLVSGGSQDSAPAADLADRVARIEVACGALAARPVAPASSMAQETAQRIDALEARNAAIDAILSAPAIPADLLDRIALLEARADVPQSRIDESPPAAIVRRLADLEARMMALRPTTSTAAPDLALLERRIAETGRAAEDYTARVEKFVGQRIDALETSLIAAPPPPPVRRIDVEGLERQVIELARRLDDAAAPDGVESLAERVSNLEVGLLEFRAEMPSGEVGDDDLTRRIALLEERNGEILMALRNVLALLTARSEQRAAS